MRMRARNPYSGAFANPLCEATKRLASGCCIPSSPSPPSPRLKRIEKIGEVAASSRTNTGLNGIRTLPLVRHAHGST
jgi:hypothetical protein